MQKNSLQPLMVSMLMIAGVSLSACNDSNPSAESEASVSSTTEEVATEATTDSTDAADLDGAVASQGTPISYDMGSQSMSCISAFNYST